MMPVGARLAVVRLIATGDSGTFDGYHSIAAHRLGAGHQHFHVVVHPLALRVMFYHRQTTHGAGTTLGQVGSAGTARQGVFVH